MSIRIRSVKPEWLDDERMGVASSDARVLSVALILLADDFGNGAAGRVMLASRVFPGKSAEVLDSALSELSEWFVTLYEVDGQSYFSIRNWSKHQKINGVGKAKFPPPQGSTVATFGGQAKPDAAVARSELIPTTMGRDWQPPDELVTALAAKWGVTKERILAEVHEFRWYWVADKGSKVRRNVSGWSKTFSNRITRLAENASLYAGKFGAPTSSATRPVSTLTQEQRDRVAARQADIAKQAKARETELLSGAAK